MTCLLEPTMFTVPLGQAAHRQAQTLRQRQASPQKAKQVYLNTLAVYAVHHYLQSLDIATDLNASDSQDPVLASLSDTADLVLGNGDRLECRPVLPGRDVMEIPPEVWAERTGFVAVALDPELRSGNLLGFVPSTETATVRISALQPLPQLLRYLASRSTPTMQVNEPINLSQWLEGIFEAGWSAISDLLTPNQALAFAVRTSADLHDRFSAGKLINLGMQLENQPLLLLAGITPEPDGRMRVLIRLCPALAQDSLPARICLTLRTQSGQVLSQVQEPIPTDYIQLLPFKLQAGTRFGIEVALGETSVLEQLIV